MRSLALPPRLHEYVSASLSAEQAVFVARSWSGKRNYVGSKTGEVGSRRVGRSNPRGEDRREPRPNARTDELPRRFPRNLYACAVCGLRYTNNLYALTRPAARAARDGTVCGSPTRSHSRKFIVLAASFVKIRRPSAPRSIWMKSPSFT